MPITKNVIFVAKEGCMEELKSLLQKMVKPSQAESGCLLYHIYQKVETPDTFVVLESWADEPSLKGHQNSAHYAEYKAVFEPFCKHKESHLLEEIW